jgi:glycosyltransferase involved in cell wall biosynthesis
MLRKILGRGSLVLCDSRQTVDDPAELLSFRAHIEHRARNAKVADRVHIYEFDRRDMPAAYRASDLVWYPTVDEEPLGLVPLEAMACGVPVIASRSGGMLETVVHNETGLVVAKADSAALASAALGITADTDAARKFRTRLTYQAQKDVTRFSVEHYLDALEHLYLSSVGLSP